MTRTITTAAELDALPFPSAVAFPGHGDWHKIRDGRWLCDDGDVLTSGALALVANGELAMIGDPSAHVLVVSDAAVEAAARALRIAEVGDSATPGFAARQWDNGSANREKPIRLARAVLTAALPFLGAAPSVPREDVGWIAESVAQDHRVEKILRPDDEVRHVYLGCSCGLGPISYLSHAAHVAYMTLDALLDRHTITPRTDR